MRNLSQQIYWQLLLFLVLLLVVGCRNVNEPGAAGIGDELFPNLGNSGYDVQHYDLDISWDEKTGEIEGIATITAVATQNLSGFNLDLHELTVDSVIFGPSVYLRGALTLHALRHKVGDEIFFEILKTYADRYAHSNVTGEDFIAIAEEISGEALDELFNAWLFKPELPELSE